MSSCCPDSPLALPARRPHEEPGMCAQRRHCPACRAGAWGDFDCPWGVRNVEESLRVVAGELPSLTERAKSFFGALKRAALAEQVLLPPEKAEARLAVCRQCPWLHLDKVRCQPCGCYVAVKARFQTETCPKGQWPESADLAF